MLTPDPARVPCALPAALLACRARARKAEQERDKERDLAKERARQVNADNEAADTDEDEEPWRRRPYRGRCAAGRQQGPACSSAAEIVLRAARVQCRPSGEPVE